MMSNEHEWPVTEEQYRANVADEMAKNLGRRPTDQEVDELIAHFQAAFERGTQPEGLTGGLSDLLDEDPEP